MTNQEYAELKQFSDLPLYDEDDPRCSLIDTLPPEPLYQSVVEVTDIVEAHTQSRRNDFVPAGAIRHWNVDRTDSMICVYFFHRRTDG